MERFVSGSEERVIFISGGTDRELDFGQWAKTAKKLIKLENLILLSGSATEKMKKELGWDKFNEFDSLEKCLEKALEIARTENKNKIIFSPGAKSFEKFKNEFDRGEQFNVLVGKI
jgi:UDP-N-acetylmuramoylalanine--D-glutamate ligase